MLDMLNLEETARGLREVGLDTDRSKTLEDAKEIANSVVMGRDRLFERFKLAIHILAIPPRLIRPILKRWSMAGYPPFVTFAPYAAFVLSVEIFFLVALTANLISSQRHSNRIDIAYLFYLPFCMIFTSSDRLHERCAPLFLRSDQDFIRGQDLKRDLHRLDKYFWRLPEEEKNKGLNAFARTPPVGEDSLIKRLWDRHLRPSWQDVGMKATEKDPVKNRELIDRLNAFSKGKRLMPEEVDFDLRDPDLVAVERRVFKKRGKWWQLPKNLKESDEH